VVCSGFLAGSIGLLLVWQPTASSITPVSSKGMNLLRIKHPPIRNFLLINVTTKREKDALPSFNLVKSSPGQELDISEC